MNQVLRKVPRPLFILNYYAYPIIMAMFILVSVTLLSRNGLTLSEILILIVIMLILGLVWWRLHARPSADLPTTTNARLDELWRAQPYTLLAFESEYCPVSMAMERQVSRLKDLQLKDLKIYKVSIHKEPGRKWFQQFDGRATPSYILLNNEGQVVMDWPLVLPVERIHYAVINKLRRW